MTKPSVAITERRYVLPLILVTSLFFLWAFGVNLNDILIPHLKKAFRLTDFRSSLIQTAFFGGYFLAALPAGWLMEKIGYKRGILVGLLTCATGALLFIPAASVRLYAFFLFALFIMACGQGVLEVAANPYVAVLGKPETASSRLNLTQAFNSLGTAIGPYLGGLFILSTTSQTAQQIQSMSVDASHAYHVQQAASVKVPYLIIGVALILFAGLISLVKLPAIPGTEKHGVNTPFSSLFKYKHLILGAVGIFVYVGAEVSIGSFLINYLSQPNIGNLSEVVAAKYVAYYWGGAMVGRFVGSALLQKIKTGTLLGIFGLVAALLVCTTMLTTGMIAMWSVILVGFFNSIMFPSIYTLGIARLGPLTGDGSGLMIMAIVGGAILPVVQGAIADRIGIHHAFILPVICYLYIVYYAFRGSRPVVPA